MQNNNYRMKKIGIITIHKIFNYGSIFQAYALQEVCREMGNEVEVIDYQYPNAWHAERTVLQGERKETSLTKNTSRWKQLLLKLLFAYPLYRQHKAISEFVRRYHKLSLGAYNHPDALNELADRYDLCIVGSDQVWNPRYCKCDPAFFLTFASDKCVKAAYASSFGVHSIDDADIRKDYAEWLSRFSYLSVREKSGMDIVRVLTGQECRHVVDPTLLLNSEQWNRIARQGRQIRKKYILCYFLNYTFDAFPRVNEIADYISRTTGWEIVYVARPPYRLHSPNTTFRVGASPAEFLSLVRDAELVLTTSFHGTAFSVNFSKPLYAVVENKQAADSRLLSLLDSVGLSHRALALDDELPRKEDFMNCDYEVANSRLNAMRDESMDYLKQFCK